MAGECQLCSTEAPDELVCKLCKSLLHFTCAIGTPVNNQGTRGMFKASYTCPVCLVSQHNDLVLQAVSRNQHHIRTSVAAVTAADAARDSTHNQPAADAATDPTHVQPTGETLPPTADPTHMQPTGETLPPTAVVAATPPAPAAVAELANQGVDPQGDADLSSSLSSISGSQRRRPRTSTIRSGQSFTPVVSETESRRVKRAKGMLHGLKHLPPSVVSVVLLDSNGRDIKGEDIDGSGSIVAVRSIGGLCVAALTQALKECKAQYPAITSVYCGLGTNDRLHRGEHPGDKIDYIKGLDREARKVFPNAAFHFILPFSSIKNLGHEYVMCLGASIKDSHVKWRVHKSPSMKDKLQAPKFVHLTKEARPSFTQWLRKIMKLEQPVSASVPPSTSSNCPLPPPNASHVGVGLPSVQPGVISQCPSSGNCIHGLNRGNNLVMGSGESNIDNLIKERLFQLVTGPHTFARLPTGARWVNQY